MEKKLLIAMDASVYSSNTLHYLERLFGGQEDIRIHLLTVIPCSPSEAASQWLNEQELMNSLSREKQKQCTSAKKFLHRAVERLGRNGIAPEQVSTELKISTTSPAAEVLNCARKGMFDALVIGRRGVSKLEELIMGSVSSTMVQKCHDVPIWIIDGVVDSRTFLVPVDGSHFTLNAVDHLCHILKGNPHAEVTLFHSASMFAQKQDLSEGYCNRLLSPEWCGKHGSDKEIYFLAPRQMLINSGFPPERIHRLETRKGMYPSRQIVRQALIDDFGTIVMGRRHKEMAKGVFGSVTEKVLAMSDNTAVWIVG
ncbi:MAG: universal stress protein [Deltaproteobacteria bacterium]|jgi:nucleotide-binding universal stress UspA family protein|nr:universal stress protein [Deltaproteobacteria bacterium]